MDKEQLERFAEQPEVLLDPGDYTLRIEEVQIAQDRLSIRPLCIVVGGDSDGKKVCPETTIFMRAARTLRQSATCTGGA